MNNFILNETDTSMWHALVNEAQGQLSLQLGEELESYLVFMLIRYTDQSELAGSALGKEYLQSQQQSGAKRHIQLRDVGDKCLLLSGLFPGSAPRRHVSLDYFIRVGQSAYAALSGTRDQHHRELFAMLASSFVDMMDVLQTLRDQSGVMSQMLPSDALDIWQKHHSRAARSVLETHNHHELAKMLKKFN